MRIGVDCSVVAADERIELPVVSGSVGPFRGPRLHANLPAAMSALDKIRIAGFKSIRDQTLELRPLNVLIGANGAGKSNFIGAFRLLNQIVASNLQLYTGKAGGAESLLHFGRKVTEAIELELTFNPNSYQCRLDVTDDDSLLFGEERISYRGSGYDNPYVVPLGAGHKETALFHEAAKSKTKSIAEHVLDATRSWQVYHFHDTSSSAKVKLTGNLNENDHLKPDAANLAAFLFRLQETREAEFRNVVETIRLAAPFFGRFRLQPSHLNPLKIRLEWFEKDSDSLFDASALSDGTLRFICLATLLLQPKLPSTILIDEPELGLHPYAINLLASLLRSAAKRTQVIVSTQSVTLVNQLSPEDIVVVDRSGGESIFRRLGQETIASWLDDYSLGELWEKNVLGGRPHA